MSGMVFGPLPDFEAVIDAVTGLEQKINVA